MSDDDELRVDPVDLLLSGSLTAEHADELLKANEATIAKVAGSEGGLVGESAVAVTSLLASWRDFTLSMHQQLTGHAEHLVAGGLKYRNADQVNASDIATVVPGTNQLNLE